MLKAIQRFLFWIIFLFLVLFLLYQGFLYLRVRPLLPTGLSIGGIDVSQMSHEEAEQAVRETYLAPLYVVHPEEQVALNPADVGFVIDFDEMMKQAEQARVEQNNWSGFLSFLLERPLNRQEVDLVATHDPARLAEQLQLISEILDVQPQAASLAPDEGEYQEGRPGYATDVQASLPEIEAALYRDDERTADLIVNEVAAPEFGIELLAANLESELKTFNGIGSIFVMDLQTGEEVSINGDLALSGLSILKIGIFMETYRALEVPVGPEVEQLLYETAVLSSNYGANLLLHEIAGSNNTYEGAEIFTDSMHRLGLVNTFMAIPYDAPTVSTRPSTYQTPANSIPNLTTFPDSARQTTAEDMGTLLSMIYYCSKGGGALIAVYGDQITPDECQAILDLMVQNVEGNLIRFGVPEEVPVSHKHGWGDNITHGDAGIVFSPGGDYVIVTYLHDPDTDFLVSDYSFPIMWELSRITYNYFNPTTPNLEDPVVRAEREARARGTYIDPETGLNPADEAEEGEAEEPPTDETNDVSGSN